MTLPEIGIPPPQAHVIKLSHRDLLDYRAIQRTFDGAYSRTALGQLCYAIVILRLFQPQFFYVGLVYAILGMGFVPVAIFRYRMAVSNSKKFVKMEVVRPRPGDILESDANPEDSQIPPDQNAHQRDVPNPSSRDSAPPPVQTVLRESFVTAGSVVAGATAFVGLVEIALLVLILRL